MILTYGDTYPDGSRSMGGYGDYVRIHEHFVFKIPETLPSEMAATMFCAGITMYSPLKRNGVGPGKTVGIIGIGGLGLVRAPPTQIRPTYSLRSHFGLLWAKALGADKVVAISRTLSKSEDAHNLGADAFIATEEDPMWAEKNASSVDLIVCTSYAPNMPISRYLQLIKPHGTYIQVGIPDDEIPAFRIMPMMKKGVMIGGSLIGSPAEISEMLELAASKEVRPWVNLWPMSDVNEALAAFYRGEPRYRIVLVNQKHMKH